MPKRRNPLKADPTRTATLRRIFSVQMTKRVRELKKRVRELIIDEDAFALRTENRVINSLVSYEGSHPNEERTESLFGRVDNTRWQFRTDEQKVKAFESWMAIQFSELGMDNVSQIEDAFWHSYVAQAYEKGAGRAFTDVRKGNLDPSDFFDGSKQEFLRQSFGHPVSIEKVKLLSGRVLTDLKGVNQATSTQLSRVLVDGFAAQNGPREIAREITKQIDKITKNRSLMIARTEVIRAHAEGQLDSLERLGVEKVGVAVEWSTTGDDRVCPLCQPLEGVVMKLKEARGTLPRHPSCRCAWIPANVGESDPSDKKTKSKVQKGIDKSVKAEIPEKSRRSLATQKKLSRWEGAGKKITSKRPKQKKL